MNIEFNDVIEHLSNDISNYVKELAIMRVYNKKLLERIAELEDQLNGKEESNK